MRLRSHHGARRDFNLAVDWYIAEAGIIAHASATAGHVVSSVPLYPRISSTAIA